MLEPPGCTAQPVVAPRSSARTADRWGSTNPPDAAAGLRGEIVGSKAHESGPSAERQLTVGESCRSSKKRKRANLSEGALTRLSPLSPVTNGLQNTSNRRGTIIRHLSHVWFETGGAGGDSGDLIVFAWFLHVTTFVHFTICRLLGRPRTV